MMRQLKKKEAGKGDKPRPRQVSQEEYDLRWDYGMGKITKEEFDRRIKDVRKRNDKG